MSEETQVPRTGRALRGIKPGKSRLARLVFVLEYALFISVMALFRALGLRRASDLGGWLARTLGPRIPVTRRARRNMARAMPEIGEAEREQHIRAMWDNLGRMFAEYPHIDKFHVYGPGARIELIGVEHARQVASEGRGGLFVSGHCGNWELFGACVRDMQLKGTLVYRPPNNPYVDAWIAQQRRIGIPTLAAKGGDGAKAIIRTLKEGGFLAMLVDQKMNDGISVPFFGLEAMTANGAPGLSVRHRAPILPAWCERLPDQHFRMTIYPPIRPPESGDRERDIYDLALQLNRFIEARIRENPSNWLWLHSRWPKG